MDQLANSVAAAWLPAMTPAPTAQPLPQTQSGVAPTSPANDTNPSETETNQAIVQTDVVKQAVDSRQNLGSPTMAAEAGRINDQPGRAGMQTQPTGSPQAQTQSQALSESPAIKAVPGSGRGSLLDTSV